MLERFFKLKANNTTVKVEVLAGITTFMTMAYIIALNPNLLTGFGIGELLVRQMVQAVYGMQYSLQLYYHQQQVH